MSSCFFILSVHAVYDTTAGFAKQIVVFGRDLAGASIALVLPFQPYILCRTSSTCVRDHDQLFMDINLRHGNQRLLSHIEISARTPLIGYHYNRSEPLLVMVFENLVKFSKRNLALIREVVDTDGTLLHDDWDVVSQFMHTKKIRLQTWVSLTVDFRLYQTTIHRLTANGVKLEYRLPKQVHYQFETPTQTEFPILPQLTIAYLDFAAADVLTPSTVISVDIAGPSPWRGSTIYDLIGLVLGEHDVDLLIYSSQLDLLKNVFGGDEVDESEIKTATYVAATRRLTHYFDPVRTTGPLFMSSSSSSSSSVAGDGGEAALVIPSANADRIVRGPRAKIFDTSLAVGRICINLMAVMRKKQVDPPLEQHDLETMLFHSKLFPKHYREFVAGTRLVATLTADERLAFLREYTCDHHLVLELLEMSRSSVSCSIDECVAGGMQVRVWKTLMSTIHAEGWFIDRAFLNSRRAILLDLHESDSSFPDIRRQDDASSSSASASASHEDVVQRIRLARTRAAPKTNIMEKFVGAYVVEPKPGRYTDPVATLDFSSMYPSIIQSYGICYSSILFHPDQLADPRITKMYVPLTDDECVVFATHLDGRPIVTMLPRLIAQAMAKREHTKKCIAEEKNPEQKAGLKMVEMGLKVFNNSIYGVMGVEKEFAKLALHENMGSVTAIGRYMTHRVIHFIETEGGQVVYGDTDSIMFYLPRLRAIVDPQEALIELKRSVFDLASRASAMFPAPNRLTPESFKCPFYLYRKKCYAALEFADLDWSRRPKLVMKGFQSDKRNHCRFTRECGRRCMAAVLYDNCVAIPRIVCDAVEHLLSGNLPYEQLAITCGIKSPTEYKSKTQVQLTVIAKKKARGEACKIGSRVSYVILRGEESQYLRGEDCDYARENKLKLDTMYYFTRQFVDVLQPFLAPYVPDIGTVFERLRGDVVQKIAGIRDIRSMFVYTSHEEDSKKKHVSHV